MQTTLYVHRRPDAPLSLLIDHARRGEAQDPKHCACNRCESGLPHEPTATFTC